MENWYWLGYVITLVGSLAIALISVWIAQRWSNKTGYKKGLKYIRSEVVANLKGRVLINKWVDDTEEVLSENKVPVKSCPRLYSNALNRIKGEMGWSNDRLEGDYDVLLELDDLCFFIDHLNEMIRWMEDSLWGIGNSMSNTDERRESLLKVIRDCVGEELLETLEKLKKYVNKRLEPNKCMRIIKTITG